MIQKENRLNKVYNIKLINNIKINLMLIDFFLYNIIKVKQTKNNTNILLTLYIYGLIKNIGVIK
jgi:hypothetical protein